MTTRPSVLLALETSAPVGSVALARDGEVVARAFLEEESGHASRLVPSVERVLEEAGVARGDLGGVVAGAGPGSFTGVRIAAATAKGLVHALGIPCWAVSSLEAAAVADEALPVEAGPWAAPPGEHDGHGDDAPGAVRYVLFDARGERVYAACYRRVPGTLEVLRPPRATRIGEVLADALPDGVRFAGTGALRHARAIRRRGLPVLPPPAGLPTADGLLDVLARGSGRAPLEDPWRWEPDYLRTSGAERERRR